jgi:hypothetical protein
MIKKLKEQYPTLTDEHLVDGTVELRDDGDSKGVYVESWSLPATVAPTPEEWDVIKADTSEDYSNLSVGKVKLLVVLLGLGITEEDIEASIGSDPVAQLKWRHTINVDRSHPLSSALGQALGKSESEIDQIFIAASEVEL